MKHDAREPGHDIEDSGRRSRGKQRPQCVHSTPRQVVRFAPHFDENGTVAERTDVDLRGAHDAAPGEDLSARERRLNTSQYTAALSASTATPAAIWISRVRPAGYSAGVM